nr:capsular polysaccharide synthesis protein [Psychrobacter sp. JCM 18900]
MTENRLPESVKLYFKSVDKHAADYKIIRLDDSNIYDYLDLPDFIWDKKNVSRFQTSLLC